LNKWAVEKQTSLDITTIYRKMKAGTFSTTCSVGKRRVAWRESDIAAWAGRSGGWNARVMGVSSSHEHNYNKRTPTRHSMAISVSASCGRRGSAHILGYFVTVSSMADDVVGLVQRCVKFLAIGNDE
jgi:predicted DNA-binding transcriptional regulator AlpA